MAGRRNVRSCVGIGLVENGVQSWSRTRDGPTRVRCDADQQAWQNSPLSGPFNSSTLALMKEEGGRVGLSYDMVQFFIAKGRVDMD